PAAPSTVTSMTAPLLVPLGGRARCAVGPRGFPAGPPDGSPPAPLPAAPTRRRPPRGSRPRIERHRPEAPPPHSRFRRSPKPWSFRREPPPGEHWTFFALSGLFAYFWSFCSSRGIPFAEMSDPSPPATPPIVPDVETNDGSARRPGRLPGRVVAVTGTSAFLRTNLIGLLEDSDRIERVVSLDRSAPATAGPKTRHFDVDLTRGNPEERIAEILASEQVDTLVHLPFRGSPSHRPGQVHELESVGPLHAPNACRRPPAHKVVLWSQTFLYGAHPTNPNFLSESHPLRADRSDAFFADKIEAEADALDFGKPGRGRTVTILRTAPIVGPTIDNYFTRYLRQAVVPTVMGFDPLWQFLHESDAVAAFKRAIDWNAPGIFNISGEGVLLLR